MLTALLHHLNSSNIFFPDDIQLTREKQRDCRLRKTFSVWTERIDCGPNKLWEYMSNLLCEKQGPEKEFV